ncbi:hypothetical protein ACE2AJ_18455 [Aquihabitans daechungensis]|uniref:hypothetical protein n=1 Tax=Aquihabitans daechungensis TaxID=1052257 RepID=UPI003BA34FB4
MMKSRGAAVIGAFVLIALAIFVRGLLVDDDGGGGGSNGPGKDDDGPPVVACTPELMAVCDALAAEGDISDTKAARKVRTLDLEGASAPDSKIDGWITWDPAPQIANFDAGQNEVWAESEALGSARLAALLDPATADALTAACRRDTVWACVAEAPVAGLTIGVGEPDTAEGLSRLYPLAAALTADLDAQALDANDLRDLVKGPTSQADAETMARSATQPGQVSIVVGPEVVLGRIGSSAQGQNRKLRTSVAKPKTTATIVIAPRSGRDVGDLADACEDDDVAEALRAAGVEPCSDDRDDVDRAGFLYLVREKAS